MSPDPAASYRHRTDRQRRQAENRFSREAAETLARYQAKKDAAAIAANLERQRGLLAAAKSVLAKGSLKGEPLTPSKRREVEDIARRARRVLPQDKED